MIWSSAQGGNPRASEGAAGRMVKLEQARWGALDPGSFPLPPTPPAVDGGIILEKEFSKDELLAVLELYREVRGANSDITQLLRILSQMERCEVGSSRASSHGGSGF